VAHEVEATQLTVRGRRARQDRAADHPEDLSRGFADLRLVE
jgi:hypothetical protein